MSEKEVTTTPANRITELIAATKATLRNCAAKLPASQANLIEDCIYFAGQLTSGPDARLIAAAPIGDKLAQAILDQDTDGLDRSEYLLKLAKEFKAKAKGA